MKSRSCLASFPGVTIAESPFESSETHNIGGSDLRILLAGDFRFAWWEEACARALERLGHVVTRFRWSEYFSGFFSRVEQHFSVSGPAVRRLNADLLEVAIGCRPDLILIWRGVQVLPSTLQKLRASTGATLTSNNNDDPFSPLYAESRKLHLRRLWANFRASIPEYDHHFVPRSVNLNEYLSAGARRVHLFRHYFVPEIHRPMEISSGDREKYGCDAVFVGHYEKDGRLERLEELAAAGLRVRLFGTGWPVGTRSLIGSPSPPVAPVYLDEYAKALCSARLCLCFHSKLNRDQYTCRTFEIPACGGLLVSERTEDTKALFRDGEEAILFSTGSEFLERTVALSSDEERRVGIASAGRVRCVADGHDVLSRMREYLTVISR